MDLQNQVNKALATEQWTNLHDRIVEYGGSVVMIKHQPNLPDMVFTANGGTVFKDKKMVVISNFKHEERKGEEEWFVQWFAEAGWTFSYPTQPYEGAGDALLLLDTLVCGTGFRSEASSHHEVENWSSGEILIVNLVDPRFYHLDTCFCPLDGKDYLIYPGAFDEVSIEAIRRIGGNELAVPEDEARKFACNAVCIGKNVILPSDCPKTMQLLSEAGYNPVAVNMSEFIKSGGACKCLTLEIA
jgi:N-dimethylarginine dimethylaminohydrolase